LFEIIKSPVFDAVGELVGVMGTGRNITERRAGEVALAQALEQQRMFELCISKLNDAVIISRVQPFEDPDPRIVFVNDAFERMTGYSRSEVMNQNPELLQGPDTQLSEQERMRLCLSQWQPAHAELIYYKKDGQQFWSEIDTVQMAYDLGWFRIAVMRDISERKNIEAEMLHICDRALEASRLKSEFLSTISHEMRTPMNGVLGMAQVLQDTPLTDTQQKYMGHIVSAAQDYMQVIDKALDFSKLDSGQLTIESLPFALQPMLQGIDELMRTKAVAKQLALHITQDAELPSRLLGDERRLRQCLLAMLDNAVKFTSKGSVVLDIKTLHCNGGEPALRFAVTDTGIGLSESDRSRLFHPFVQGDGSKTRRYGGIGLGLVICQQLVELMHGRMGVDSTPGQGSTFWFELPLREAP
jgi:polar amino acid transport system substrate-binding protein